MASNQATANKRILVVDDDPDVLRFVAVCLRNQGYEVQTASNGLTALDFVVQARPQLVLLDLTMPEMSGFEVLKNIRENIGLNNSALPVIFLSAHGEDEAKVQALDLGADDYLTKPFSVVELQARVRVALRRVAELNAAQTKPEVALPSQQEETGRYFRSGSLEIDLVGRVVRVNGQEVRLTPTEYNLLEYLVENAGKVITHRQLLQKVWGQEYNNETEYLRTFIKQLRRKLEADPSHPVYLLTEPGIGYRFRPA